MELSFSACNIDAIFCVKYHLDSPDSPDVSSAVSAPVACKRKPFFSNSTMAAVSDSFPWKTNGRPLPRNAREATMSSTIPTAKSVFKTGVSSLTSSGDEPTWSQTNNFCITAESLAGASRDEAPRRRSKWTRSVSAERSNWMQFSPCSGIWNAW